MKESNRDAGRHSGVRQTERANCASAAPRPISAEELIRAFNRLVGDWRVCLLHTHSTRRYGGAGASKGPTVKPTTLEPIEKTSPEPLAPLPVAGAQKPKRRNI